MDFFNKDLLTQEKLLRAHHKKPNIVEVRKPEIDAQLIADNIAEQLQRRASFRRTMKRAIQSALRLGAQGIKIVSETTEKPTETYAIFSS